MKYLLLLLVVLVVVWLLFGARRRSAARRPTPDARPQAEGMLVCAHCGVHLPRSDALLDRGQPYCSAAHRDAGPRDR